MCKMAVKVEVVQSIITWHMAAYTNANIRKICYNFWLPKFLPIASILMHWSQSCKIQLSNNKEASHIEIFSIKSVRHKTFIYWMQYVDCIKMLVIKCSTFCNITGHNLRLHKVWKALFIGPSSCSLVKSPAIVIFCMSTHIHHCIDWWRATK